MIDRRHIGRTLPSLAVEVEKGRLRLFAQAIGETNPIYFDEAAARAAGYRSLPAPPTFAFCLEMETADPFAVYREIGMDVNRMLHGEQSFVYRALICAGDVVTFDARIDDIYDKKNGALEFVVKATRVSNARGEHVADLRSVLVMRNG